MGRNTVAMVAVFLVLVGGAWALNTTQPIKTDTTEYVLEVKDTEVQRIDITTAGGSTAFERADPFGWKFAISGDQADLSRVTSVVNRLAKLRSSSKVADKVDDLSPYGLNPPADTAVLALKDGTTHRVLIGSKTPNDAAYYALVEAKAQLHTINTLLVGDIEKLVSDPPVSSPTPAASPTSSATSTPTPTPSESSEEVAPEAPVATVGLPAPAPGT